MAEPTPTNGNAPLSEAEQKQLDELTARRDRAAAEADRTSRAEKLAALGTANALIKLIRTDKITAAFDAVMNDPAIPFETKSKIQGVRSSIDYSFGSIETEIASLSAPAAA